MFSSYDYVFANNHIILMWILMNTQRLWLQVYMSDKYTGKGKRKASSKEQIETFNMHQHVWPVLWFRETEFTTEDRTKHVATTKFILWYTAYIIIN